MADYDRNRGNRDTDSFRRPRPQQPAQQAGDPLAELARLIGQQNESAPSYRQNGARAPYGNASDADRGWATPEPVAKPAGRRQEPAPSSWAPSYPDEQNAAPAAYGNSHYDQRYDPSPRDSSPHDASPHHSSPYAPPFGEVRPAEPRHSDSRYVEPQADTHYADPRYSDQAYADPRYAAGPHYDDPRYGDPRYADPRYDGTAHGYAEPQYAEPQYADPHYSDPRYAEPNFAAPPAQYGASAYAPAPGYPQSDQGYAGYGYPDDRQPQHYDNSYYGAPPAAVMPPAADERRPAKQRRSIVTVLAVLALAVVGTASAFGYRAMFGGSGTPVPPPVIKADTQPSKVVPATDPNAKPIQDRVGVKTERIVPRQEEPVQQAAPGQPRVIAPWLAGQSPQSFPPAAANVAPAAAPAPAAAAQPASGEPKRIRTVPIKPEQGAEAPAPRSSRHAAPAAAAQPDNDPAAAHAQAGNSPLALQPTGSVPADRRQSGRQAALQNPGGAFPTPIPSSGPAAAAGAYGVQVTSQRSEADAQASYRSLQQQFPSVLGGRQPVIRRADLGEKGTYYRAQVPFQTQAEASEFCSSLKAAGGQCVVQRN